MLKHKLFFLLSGLLLSNELCFSQLSLQIQHSTGWKTADAKAICPSVDYNFRIVGWEALCYSVTYTNTNATPVPDSDGVFSLQALDTGESTIIDVKKSGGTCSSNAQPEKKLPVNVLSLTKTTPEIVLKSGSLNVGFVQNPVEFVARTKWPFLGFEDDPTIDPLKFKTYDWNWSWDMPEWMKQSGGAQDSNIIFKTNIGGGGFLYARAHNGACTNATKSINKTHEVKRTINSPCPIKPVNRGFELCGTSGTFRFNCDTLPLNYEEDNPTWTWSVTTLNGITNMQSLGNTYQYKSDGSNARTVNVTVSDYGVSNSCALAIPMRVINPTATVDGKNLVCGTETYVLSHAPGLGTTTTWVVKSTKPNTPAPVTPTSGSGITATISPSGFGEAMIEFTITGCGQTVKLTKTFFAGKPSIKPGKVDGRPLSSGMNYVCPTEFGGGSHYITVNLEGDTDGCVDNWVVTGAGPTYHGCNELDFLLQYNPSKYPPYNCVTINAYASNLCGTQHAIYIVCPSNHVCQGNPFKLSISPNPTSDVATVALRRQEGNELISLTIGNLDVLDKNGNLVHTAAPDASTYQFNTATWPNGTYYVRTNVDALPIVEELIVNHGN
jgi:hypothetical protein